MRRGTFKPEIIKRIAEIGHEVGYHYEALDKTRGDYEKAIKIFQDELEEFRKIYDVKTICAHGNLLTKWDNRDLWKEYNFKDYHLLGEAYLSLDNKIPYFTDSGRTWNRKYRIKDRLQGELRNNLNVTTTSELIQLLKKGDIDKIYILAHPERWAQGYLGWLSYYVRDMAANIVRSALYSLRTYTS